MAIFDQAPPGQPLFDLVVSPVSPVGGSRGLYVFEPTLFNWPVYDNTTRGTETPPGLLEIPVPSKREYPGVVIFDVYLAYLTFQCPPCPPLPDDYPPGPGQFTLTRSGPTVSPLTVSVALTGTATNGVDYVTIPQTVTFAPNSSTAAVNVVPLVDTIPEGAETVIMTITPSGNYQIGAAGTATVTIES